MDGFGSDDPCPDAAKAFITGQPQTLVGNPEGRYRLFRIGDAVSSRNIHAAILDAYRLMVAL